jgi:hypothetical protein
MRIEEPMSSIPSPEAGDKHGTEEPLAPMRFRLYSGPDPDPRMAAFDGLPVELAIPASLAELLAEARQAGWEGRPTLGRSLAEMVWAQWEAGRAQAARAAAACPSASGARPDGPDQELPLFWWQRTSYHLPPTPARMLRLMWGRDSVEVEDDLLWNVWGYDYTDNALKNAYRAVNKVLASSGYPRFLGVKDGRLCWSDP